MIINSVKTFFFLATLSALIMFMGALIGGYDGIHIAFIIALLMNGILFFFSDKIVLSMYYASPLSKEQYHFIYEMVTELSTNMKLPMPRLWLIRAPYANAFATGRNPSHASIALTQEIIELLEPHELRGVLAHELSHIKNRDILIATIAATLVTTISYMGNMIQHMLFWRSFNRNRQNQNTVGLFLSALLIPFIATLMQCAISRSREYEADNSGAYYSRDPLALASALKKIQQQTAFKENVQDIKMTSTATLFIVNPFLGKNWIHIFSTHPPTEQRIARLQQIFEKGF